MFELAVGIGIAGFLMYAINCLTWWLVGGVASAPEPVTGASDAAPGFLGTEASG